MPIRHHIQLPVRMGGRIVNGQKETEHSRVVEGGLERVRGVKGRPASAKSYESLTGSPGFRDYCGEGKRGERQAVLLYGVLSLWKF